MASLSGDETPDISDVSYLACGKSSNTFTPLLFSMSKNPHTDFPKGISLYFIKWPCVSGD